MLDVRYTDIEMRNPSTEPRIGTAGRQADSTAWKWTRAPATPTETTATLPVPSSGWYRNYALGSGFVSCDDD
jgi:hypothetical protein